MIRLTGLALAAAVLAFASTASATPAAPEKKTEHGGCPETAVAKPQSEGEGASKPATHAADASPAQAETDDRQMSAPSGSGDAKPADATATPASACAAG